MKVFLLLTASFLFYQTGVTQSLEKDFPKYITVKVRNPLNASREEVMVFIDTKQIKQAKPDFNTSAFIVVDNKKEISSQINLNDKDFPGIVFVLDKLGPKESRSIQIRYNEKGAVKHTYTKRTQAELSYKTGGEWKNREYMGGAFKNVEYLRVPPEHKDHSWFIRYEGPGWESDKVGYRFYLDQRNAVDVFGKKVPEVVLQKAGLDGFDSYHEMQPWGMDVLKVAKSLGVGTIGYLDTAAVRVEVTDSVTSRITEN